LILLLVLLPLYLWPLRGGRGSLPHASALSGPPHDPRNPAAMARIPSDVWDALMARTEGPPPAPPRPPLNLTMIAGLDEVGGAGSIHLPPIIGSSGPPSHRSLLALGGDGSPSSANRPDGDDSSPGPVQFLASETSSQERGTGNGGSGFGSGGYAGFSNLGPWNGGGPGGPGTGGAPSSGPGSTWDPNDPDSPTPTPEPATLVLVGSNLALFGAFAWKRHKRREEIDRSG
jgi:hypothetical protein